MKKLKFLIFLFIISFGINVFAEDVDVTNKCYGTTGYASMYSGDEVQYQTYSNYTFGTTYQYQLSSFYTQLRYSLTANTNYTLTFNTNGGNDFRNNFKTWHVYDVNNNDNDLVTDFTFISMKKIQLSFTTTSATNKVDIQFGGANLTDAITGNTNWNIKNVILTIPASNPTNEDIINNQTNNTQNIIDNNNQNTQDIIKSNQSCFTSNDNIPISLKNGYELNNSGLTPNSSWLVSSYMPIYEGVTYNAAGWSSNFYCIFDINFNVRQCASGSSYTAKSGDAFMVRNSTISGANNPRMWGYGSYCVSKTDIENRQNALNSKNQQDKTQDINDSINNSNIDSDVGNSFFDNFTNNMHGLSSIITIPLSSIQSLSSSTCTPLHFPIPFTDNKYLDVPCMTEIYEQHIPTLLTLIQTCWYGILAYKVLVNIFGIVKGFKDPDSDKIEVMDL